jgi:hypothetical protein
VDLNKKHLPESDICDKFDRLEIGNILITRVNGNAEIVRGFNLWGGLVDAI